jgi:hypothetical protein
MFLYKFFSLLRIIEFATLDENGITFSNVFRRIKVQWSEIISVKIEIFLDRYCLYYFRQKSNSPVFNLSFITIRTNRLGNKLAFWDGNRKKSSVKYIFDNTENRKIFKDFFERYCPDQKIDDGDACVKKNEQKKIKEIKKVKIGFEENTKRNAVVLEKNNSGGNQKRNENMKRNAVVLEKKKLFCSPTEFIYTNFFRALIVASAVVYITVALTVNFFQQSEYENYQILLLCLMLLPFWACAFYYLWFSIRTIEFATLDENGITFSNFFRKIKIVKWTEITSVGLIPLAIDEYHGRWESVAIFVQIKTEEIEVSREQRSWAGNRKKFQVSFFKASAKNFTIFRKFFGHYCPKLRINGGNRYMNAIE